MYDPTPLEIMRSQQDDRRRALERAAQRRHRSGDAPSARAPSIAIARLLRRAADRLDRPMIVRPQPRAMEQSRTTGS